MGQDLEENEELQVLTKAAKKRHEAATLFAENDRDDLATKERAEADVIRRYLPEELGEDETRALVQRIASENGLSQKSQLGALMKAVMAEYRGRVNGKLVQRVASEILA